jgi:hypothetical protein
MKTVMQLLNRCLVHDDITCAVILLSRARVQLDSSCLLRGFLFWELKFELRLRFLRDGHIATFNRSEYSAYFVRRYLSFFS